MVGGVVCGDGDIFIFIRSQRNAGGMVIGGDVVVSMDDGGYNAVG